MGYIMALIICWMWIFNFRVESLIAEISEGALPLVIGSIVASIILTVATLLGEKNPCKTPAAQIFIGIICFATSFLGPYLTTDGILAQMKVIALRAAIAASLWIIIYMIWKIITRYTYRVFFD